MKYRKFRIQDLLREEISVIIQRELRDPGLGLVTIIDVEMSEDLRQAKVYYSVYGSESDWQKTKEALDRSKGYIKFLLGKRIRIKYMPDLAFLPDRSYERVLRIGAILSKNKDAAKD
ncbi:MAG: 30S ribosome-binding factor RbfA [Desulfobacterota bacterium]|nr:30S ribosome-binding factor RbfA [Thermodesulfobacteriota bacterium]MDW8001919.1 30S ribosome-binding factor RbfA [Deltaproteobacteria bacterium]